MNQKNTFRSALAQFATGVTIITTRSAEGNDVGLTVNSFSAVSLNPPLVLWNLDKSAASLPIFEQSNHFVVHVLSAEQKDLALQFSKRGADKFLGLTFSRGLADCPLLPNSLAVFECQMLHRYEGGDHRIYVGEVIRFSQQQGHALLSFQSQLHSY